MRIKQHCENMKEQKGKIHQQERTGLMPNKLTPNSKPTHKSKCKPHLLIPSNRPRGNALKLNRNFSNLKKPIIAVPGEPV